VKGQQTCLLTTSSLSAEDLLLIILRGGACDLIQTSISPP